VDSRCSSFMVSSCQRWRRSYSKPMKRSVIGRYCSARSRLSWSSNRQEGRPVCVMRAGRKPPLFLLFILSNILILISKSRISDVHWESLASRSQHRIGPYGAPNKPSTSLCVPCVLSGHPLGFHLSRITASYSMALIDNIVVVRISFARGIDLQRPDAGEASVAQQAAELTLVITRLVKAFELCLKQ